MNNDINSISDEVETLIYLRECFLKYGIPAKYAGKVAIKVRPFSWCYPDLAKKELYSFCESVSVARKAILENFDDDGEEVFVDWLSKKVLVLDIRP